MTFWKAIASLGGEHQVAVLTQHGVFWSLVLLGGPLVTYAICERLTRFSWYPINRLRAPGELQGAAFGCFMVGSLAALRLITLVAAQESYTYGPRGVVLLAALAFCTAVMVWLCGFMLLRRVSGTATIVRLSLAWSVIFHCVWAALQTLAFAASPMYALLKWTGIGANIVVGGLWVLQGALTIRVVARNRSSFQRNRESLRRP